MVANKRFNIQIGNLEELLLEVYIETIQCSEQLNGSCWPLRPDQFNLLLLGYCEVKIGPSDRKKRKKKQSIGVWL